MMAYVRYLISAQTSQEENERTKANVLLSTLYTVIRSQSEYDWVGLQHMNYIVLIDWLIGDSFPIYF